MRHVSAIGVLLVLTLGMPKVASADDPYSPVPVHDHSGVSWSGGRELAGAAGPRFGETWVGGDLVLAVRRVEVASGPQVLSTRLEGLRPVSSDTSSMDWHIEIAADVTRAQRSTFILRFDAETTVAGHHRGMKRGWVVVGVAF